VLCLALLAYTPDPSKPAVNALPVLVAGAGGLAAGGIVTWALARTAGNPLRRAALAMMGVMGTAVVGALTVPAHGIAGAWGLGILFALCLAAIALAWHLTLRAPRA
jgi:hypothetical protein